MGGSSGCEIGEAVREVPRGYTARRIIIHYIYILLYAYCCCVICDYNIYYYFFVRVGGSVVVRRKKIDYASVLIADEALYNNYYIVTLVWL